MTKKRQGDPWMTGAEYGRGMQQFSINLVVRDMEQSLAFYSNVLEATVHYSDADFAAVRILDQEMMLHTDHTFDGHPWNDRLKREEENGRGLGVEIRLLGMDPDAVAERANEAGADIIVPVTDRNHGWREVVVADPDGYLWAVGVTIEADE